MHTQTRANVCLTPPDAYPYLVRGHKCILLAENVQGKVQDWSCNDATTALVGEINNDDNVGMMRRQLCLYLG